MVFYIINYEYDKEIKNTMKSKIYCINYFHNYSFFSNKLHETINHQVYDVKTRTKYCTFLIGVE